MALKHDDENKTTRELMTAHKSALKNTFLLLQRHTVYSQGLFWPRIHICYDSDRTMMEDAALIYKVYSEWAAFLFLTLLLMVLQLTRRSWSGVGKLSHLAPHMTLHPAGRNLKHDTWTWFLIDGIDYMVFSIQMLKCQIQHAVTQRLVSSLTPGTSHIHSGHWSF